MIGVNDVAERQSRRLDRLAREPATEQLRLAAQLRDRCDEGSAPAARRDDHPADRARGASSAGLGARRTDADRPVGGSVCDRRDAVDPRGS